MSKLRSGRVLRLASSFLSEPSVNRSSEEASVHSIGVLRTLNAPIFSTNRLLFSTIASRNEAPQESVSKDQARLSPARRKEARAAVMDYLHCTRGLQFSDAEHMSNNSPIFLDSVLEKVGKDADVGRSLARYFRYHPINEFEPFFESLGLEPSEYAVFLPRELMYLSDDDLLLENYRVLCNYGIDRSKMGKIYKEAREAFSYDYGVLPSKLQALKNLGLSTTSVIKLAESSPSLLVKDAVKQECFKVLERLKSLRVEPDWICLYLSEKNSYNWKRVLDLLNFLSGMGFDKEELWEVVSRHPDFLLDGSGKNTYMVIGLFLKFGSGTDLLERILSQFPLVQIEIFLKHLKWNLIFFDEIKMKPEVVRELVFSYFHFLGTCSLEKPRGVLKKLKVGKKELCLIIENDPGYLRNMVLKSNVPPVPKMKKDTVPSKEKIEFLVNLGFVENSDEMKQTLKRLRGKGDELQERFDCLVKCGLSPGDVANMVKHSPQILSQSSDLIKKKINILVNNLGYPLESLLEYPSFIAYTTERIKMRFAMYGWLKDRGVNSSGLALSTVLHCSDKVFLKKIVKKHPEGPMVWEKYKKMFSLHS